MGKVFQQLLIKKHKAHSHAVPDRAIYCPECGESLLEDDIHDEYVCETCLRIVNDTDKYCFYCGSKLDKTVRTRYWNQSEELDKGKFTELAEERKLKDKVKWISSSE